MPDRLVVRGDLDFAERQEFTTAASRMIEHATDQIEVDCSFVNTVDDPTIGMLVWLTRNARRRGLAVVLEAPAPALLSALDRAGVRNRFTTRGPNGATLVPGPVVTSAAAPIDTTTIDL